MSKEVIAIIGVNLKSIEDALHTFTEDIVINKATLVANTTTKRYVLVPMCWFTKDSIMRYYGYSFDGVIIVDEESIHNQSYDKFKNFLSYKRKANKDCNDRPYIVHMRSVM